jgi:hypothetical protein
MGVTALAFAADAKAVYEAAEFGRQLETDLTEALMPQES